ncbi:MAG: glycerate kinase type-2 family protein [Desulfobulbales bacterium]
MESNKRRKTARRIFESGVASVMPDRLIAHAVSLEGNKLRIHDTIYPLRPDQKVHVFGSGKGSVGMARSLLSIIGERTAGGVIVTNHLTDDALSPLTMIEGSHPVPDDNSIRGAELLMQGLSDLDSDDLCLYLLSGGSSALIEKPLHNISLADMQETTRLLLTNGVPIQQVNAVRKHLSMVKGGRLGQCTRATCAVLVISDVIGDDLSVIGSGPLYHDPTTFQECRNILERNSIWDQLSPAVRAVIVAGEKGDIHETPKHQHESINHHLIGTNRIALEGACIKAKASGLNAHILTSSLSGEAREVAKVLMALAKNINLTHEPFKPPCCLLFGGETTVTVRGTGKGGRNQELVLAALAELDTDDNILVLSGGTDGIDGNSTAAGALADNGLLKEAVRKGLSINDFLDDNNANGFFSKVGGLLETGSTGTNVMDITLLIIDKEEV